jgi:hypothetical protein
MNGWRNRFFFRMMTLVHNGHGPLERVMVYFQHTVARHRGSRVVNCNHGMFRNRCIDLFILYVWTSVSLLISSAFSCSVGSLDSTVSTTQGVGSSGEMTRIPSRYSAQPLTMPKSLVSNEMDIVYLTNRTSGARVVDDYHRN